MRHMLILLALALPIAMASPWFWTVLSMQFGAAPVVYHNQDGTPRPAVLGPKAHWPDWAMIPEAADLQVKAWFGPDETTTATGFGDMTIATAALIATTRYIEKLRQAGWRVETYQFDATQFTRRWLCIVRATRDDTGPRVIQASIEITSRASYGTIHWAEGHFPVPIQAVRQECAQQPGSTG